MNYVAYNNDGRITQSGTCQDGSLEFQGAPGTLKLEVESTVDPSKYYVTGGFLTAMPAKPSKNHQFNYTTKQWEDPRTLVDLKAEKWRNIKANRESHEYGGFTWDGSEFDSDAMSQQRIAGAVQLAQMNPEFTTVWTLKDNTPRTLDAPDMFAVGMALGVHVSDQFIYGQILRAQLEEATTAQEVEAIHW